MHRSSEVHPLGRWWVPMLTQPLREPVFLPFHCKCTAGSSLVLGKGLSHDTVDHACELLILGNLKWLNQQTFSRQIREPKVGLALLFPWSSAPLLASHLFLSGIQVFSWAVSRPSQEALAGAPHTTLPHLLLPLHSKGITLLKVSSLKIGMSPIHGWGWCCAYQGWLQTVTLVILSFGHPLWLVSPFWDGRWLGRISSLAHTPFRDEICSPCLWQYALSCTLLESDGHPRDRIGSQSFSTFTVFL